MNTGTKLLTITAAVAVFAPAALAGPSTSTTRTFANGGTETISRSHSGGVTTTNKSFIGATGKRVTTSDVRNHTWSGGSIGNTRTVTGPNGKTATNVRSTTLDGRFLRTTTDSYTGVNGQTHSRTYNHLRGRRF